MLDSGADLAGADLALASASHSGEPMHVDRALAMLDRAGVTEDDLRCPTALPMNDAARSAVLLAGDGPADSRARRIYMNCSGKHAGMLTACVAAGWPIAGYLAADHPLQRQVAQEITRLTGEAPSAVGIDGCGAPLFAVSLLALARGFGAVNGAAAGTPTHGGRRDARPPGDGRRDRPGGHPADAGLPGSAGQGRRRGGALRGPARRPVRCGEDHRRRRSGPDAGAGRRAAPAGRRLPGAGSATDDSASDGSASDGSASALLDELGTGTVLGGGVPVGTVRSLLTCSRCVRRSDIR